MDKVSIVIPFYNCQYVDRAIQSAAAQSYPNVEVIVVNDGSTRFTDKVVPFFDRIIYVEKKNGGTASALNAGIRQASGDYFAWLSSDDLYHPDKVKHQLHFMKERKAKASYTTYRLIDTNDHLTTPAMGEGFSSRYDFLKRLVRGGFINGCSVMLEMNLFKEIGLFDESLLYTQDYDFWIRVGLRHDFHFLSEPLIYYRIHEEMGTKKYDQALRKEIRMVRHKYYRALKTELMQMSGKDHSSGR